MVDFETFHLALHSMPGVTSAQQWGDNMVYKVGGKIFFLADIPAGSIHHLAFKVPKENFEELTEREGITQAPYFAKGQWVQVHHSTRFTKEELKNWYYTAHRLVLVGHTKKAQAEIESAGILAFD